MRHVLLTLSLSLLAAGAVAQTVVDYPDSTIAATSGQYPIYTGTATNVIRGQLFCPPTFAGLPTTPMILTRIGVQLADPATGPVPYAQFVVRAGATPITALTTSWNTNLPDQRVQVDLSGQTIAGIPTAANAWSDWPLANPFYWQPGQGIVLDITSQAAIAGQYLRTAIGSGVPRMISTNYTGSPTGTPSTSGGIKFRMVFEPPGLVSWGNGCAGSGNFVPQIGGIGAPSLGNGNFAVTLSNGLGGTLVVFTMGLPAQFDIGGGCRVHNTANLLTFTSSSGAGPGTGTAIWPLPIPNNLNLLGAVFDAQWGLLDTGSASPLGFSVSPGGKIVLH